MFTKNRTWLAVAPLLLIALFVVACAPGRAQPTATPQIEEPPLPTAPPPPVTPTPGDFVYGQAIVDSISIAILESFPVQVRVTAKGNLSDGCTTIDQIETTRGGNAFTTTIATKRQANVGCIEVLVPFEESFSLPVEGLPAGDYTVTVNGVSDTFNLAVDNVLGEPPVLIAAPENCLPRPAGFSPYFNLVGGYCFLYPENFRIGDVFPQGDGTLLNIMAVYGPPLDTSIEPIQAGLSIVVEGSAEGRTLAQVVDSAVLGYPDLPIGRAPATLAGEPAEIVTGLPGRSGNRQLFTIHNDLIYHITNYPVDEAMPQAEPDVMGIWNSLLDSFTYLDSAFVERLAACPAGEDGNAPYLNVINAYCLTYPNRFSLQEAFSQNLITLRGPATEAGSEAPRASLTVQMIGQASGRSLEQVVDEVTAEYSNLPLTRSEATLGGEPAVVVEGIPGVAGNRQLWAMHNGAIFHWVLSPTDLDDEAIAADVSAVWEQALDSFTFVPAES